MYMYMYMYIYMYIYIYTESNQNNELNMNLVKTSGSLNEQLTTLLCFGGFIISLGRPSGTSSPKKPRW